MASQSTPGRNQIVSWKETETLASIWANATKTALEAAYTASGVKGFWRKRLDMLIEEFKQTYVSTVTIAQIYAQLDEKDKLRVARKGLPGARWSIGSSEGNSRIRQPALRPALR